MISFASLQERKEKICVVGMGYVGLPLAVLLARHFDVIGYDIDAEKIAELQRGVDRTREVNTEDLENTTVTFTADPADIAQARFIIVAVPTPIDEHKTPDLRIVRAASQTVGAHMADGSIIVYESTVYPGVTEDICVPILEEASGYTIGTQFAVGYSPERVNPGDKEHTIDTITKVVAASDSETAVVLEGVYGAITNTFRATSIRVAEAAKVIENTQRDLNIALMNELAIVCNTLGMSVYDVLDAAGTKWNFLPFTPGLVGGHCIGVDPYYLTYKAEQRGYTPTVILAGREINDDMHMYVVKSIAKALQKKGKQLAGATVNLCGITFKENVPDVRNSKAAALCTALEAEGATVRVHDPRAAAADVAHEYNLTIHDVAALTPADVVVVAVAHNEFAAYTPTELQSLVVQGGLVADVKHIYQKDALEAAGMQYWSL